MAAVMPLPLANPSQQGYVSDLLSFTLDRLHKEPDLLRVDAERIRRQMLEVAVGHYRGFISAADAVQSISLEIAAVDHHLEGMIAEVPRLIKGCNDFMEEAQQLLEHHKLNRTLLANHNTLLDLLEIPQLMDTCVRNGNYDEALDLEAFVTKLATVHSRLPVIQSLADDVGQTTKSLLAHILQRLRSNIQLPECLRLIGYLRRLGVYSEHEMRLQFLRCREAWLTGIVDDLEHSNPYEYLKRMADCQKVHLFDVVTQYRAIFADDTSYLEEKSDGGLLYSWAMHRVMCHLAVLDDTLPRITEGVSLGIILEQSMYCGMSLGRVGLDFRNLLPPLFERSVHQLLLRNLSITIENFQHVLNSHRWVPLPPVGAGLAGNTGPDDMSPPYSLMDHHPLAMFVNGVLAALNELRHCAPMNLKAVLALEVRDVLQSVADSLLRYNATRMLRESESNLFLAMCRAFIEVACPYTVLCFGRCYPGGASLIQLQDVLEGLRRLFVTTSYQSPRGNGGRKAFEEVERSRTATLSKESSHVRGTEDLDVHDPKTPEIENGGSELHKQESNYSGSTQSNSHEAGISPFAADETVNTAT
ncbi:unnamed protein product [Calypogeia fissa]